MDQTFAIGIDLGTTYSCVSVFANGKVEIIPNDQGNKTIPSYVAFNETKILIGNDAQNQVTKNHQNTIFDIKRLIGRKFSETTVQNYIKLWSFKVEAGVNDTPMIVVNYKGENKKFLPEEISSIILSKMKETAQAYLNQQISKAVITVPAYFNDSQRQATKDAGAIAGLNVLRIINESYAAAIAYNLDKKCKNEYHALIIDLGGGNFNVSLLTIEDGFFEITATSGYNHLGGEDFDNKLVEYCCDEFFKKKGINIRGNPISLRRLRTQCERAKRILSSANQTTIEVDALDGKEDFNCTISRTKFEDLCMSLFKECITLIEKVLKESGISKIDVHEIVMVGGSSRIPKVQELVQDYFNGKTLNKSINPDEVVAYGAAIQADIIKNQDDEWNKNFLYFDYTLLSLGIETAGGIMNVFIGRNTSIPYKKSQIFTTYTDNQTNVTIEIYEGERKMTKDCKKIGQFNLDGIAPAPRGVPKIEVSFEIDINGTIYFSAEDQATKNSQKITIMPQKSRLSKDEIELLAQEAEKFRAEDDIIKSKIEAKNNIELTEYQIKNTIKDEQIKCKFTAEEISRLEQLVEERIKWIECNVNVDIQEYIYKQKEIEQIMDEMMQRIYQDGYVRQDRYGVLINKII
ncbi:unnamed protein product [Paramecium pentaurelia]|uniref:Heat shock protein 70 n=2 Tax=Paramecium pentaurelia TaxID=43138 RepID=A0A8S1UFQ4_9CILI|nr:unnamed protein product [Paramecium pentaurelia]